MVELKQKLHVLQLMNSLQVNQYTFSFLQWSECTGKIHGAALILISKPNMNKTHSKSIECELITGQA